MQPSGPKRASPGARLVLESPCARSACSSHLTHHKSGPLISAAPKRRRLFLEFFRGGIQLRAVVADPLEALGLILADTMFAREIVDFIAFAAGDAAAVGSTTHGASPDRHESARRPQRLLRRRRPHA